MKKIMMLLMLAVSLNVAAKDIKTLVLTTNPVMHCSNCENKIKNQLKYEKGVKKIVTSVPNQTVTITYDADKTTPEKLKASMQKINFTCTEVQQEVKGTQLKSDAQTTVKKNKKTDGTTGASVQRTNKTKKVSKDDKVSKVEN